VQGGCLDGRPLLLFGEGRCERHCWVYLFWGRTLRVSLPSFVLLRPKVPKPSRGQAPYDPLPGRVAAILLCRPDKKLPLLMRSLAMVRYYTMARSRNRVLNFLFPASTGRAKARGFAGGARWRWRCEGRGKGLREGLCGLLYYLFPPTTQGIRGLHPLEPLLGPS
jgi:hypothetical protein